MAICLHSALRTIAQGLTSDTLLVEPARQSEKSDNFLRMSSLMSTSDVSSQLSHRRNLVLPTHIGFDSLAVTVMVMLCY